ncbi:BTB domain and ankyrin repeat-containing protein [Pleomassaria siparia CBS 279.74]|uniref:BTB domain and ankyrin repeat-containing protein n=1 Tax=Pleomassaria siparia CBS 279.74 TaxID=1314801 RepID=A0A6G1K0M2_9PLEO|nr:BTB domain and ankyrin repeat-containing protein [Pleomassaria siparia CBS 279.74]
MSGHLWKYYFEDDVDNFQHLLETATHTTRPGTQKGYTGWQGGGFGAAVNNSPGSYGASPVSNAKSRKTIGPIASSLTRSDINSRDGTGLTILHHTASSSSQNAVGFAQALLEHPLTDVYIQDAENGWTALHRAFYFGNIAIARLILNRDTQDVLGHGSSGFNHRARGLVKIKDKEGYGPLDLFAMTIKDRTLRPEESNNQESDSDDDVAHGDSGDRDDEMRKKLIAPPVFLGGEEVYTFGSNKNVTLGFGDEDDRQFPERVVLRRPDHLLQRFYREHREQQNQVWAAVNLPPQAPGPVQAKAIADLPINIRNTPIVIQDVQMSKLHTAVLTTDPISNLYMCGHGPGGRLGTGDETTRYQFTCIESGGLGQKKVAAVALGQNHTLVITDEGEIYSWGNNTYGQLGYSLPKPTIKDDDPISTIPRQIFGTLKRELITGVSASRIHSVAHTTTSLYTFGKNEGQLGIVDSDARSLDMQIIPRKIAASLFSSAILSASAIDGATICLLENREVWVFANYGYARLNFPLDGFTNYFLKESWLTTKYETTPNKISKITSGGDTICALSSSGEVFTVAVSRRSETTPDAGTSTTNPKQIRGALSAPYRIWSAKRSHMAARDVDVDQDGSIILTTEAGSVWRRTKRATLKNATAAGTGENRPKDYKFQRVAGLTRVVAVRASAFGAYSAIRKDCDVTRVQIGVDELSLWKDIAPLLSFHDLSHYEENSDDEDPTLRFWQRPSNSQSLRKRTLKSRDLESEITDILSRSLLSSGHTYDMEIGTTLSNVRIPIHEFMLSGRSRTFRDMMTDFRSLGDDLDIPDFLEITQDSERLIVLFHGLDFLTIFNLAVYVYTDSVVDFWNATRQFPKMAFRYRTVRTELMKLASRLELRQLEPAVRQMTNPRRSFNMDMELAIKHESFFQSGDVIIELEDGQMLLHSDILCQRCPFFQGLFRGRAGGQWLAGRREESQQVRIDLTHVRKHLFEVVVRHMYTDAGEELFDDIASQDLNDFLALDELLDHVMDIMSIANELMLDRLSQICQRLIGQYVNSRNVCSLLNAIAPSSVAEFKDAALEYVCVSLEAVMQNGSLDELDDDLMLDLNEVVHANQLAYLPFARSGRAEALLFDKYPELAERIERGKRARIDAIVLSNKFSEDGVSSTSFRAQSLEELSASPLRNRTRRRVSREIRTDADSPSTTPALQSKNSAADLIFDMSEVEDEESGSKERILPPRFTQTSDEKRINQTPAGSPQENWAEVRRKSRVGLGIDEGGSLQSPSSNVAKERVPGKPWGTTPLEGTKLDLRDIMTQTPSDKPSNLTLGLYQQEEEAKFLGSINAKMTQKERKRLQQAQQLGYPLLAEKPQSTPPTVSPWQAVARKPSITPTATPSPQASRTSSTPQLTMRQTIANNGTCSKEKSQQNSKKASRTASASGASSQPHPTSSSGPGMSVSTTPIPTPHSVRHIPLPTHSPTSPSQHLSMMEILSIQEAEKMHMHDAAAKRSLQEIQQEQEFQEWWDQESQRVMLEEEQQQQQKRVEEKIAKAGVGRGRGKARGGRGKAKANGKEKGEEDVVGKDRGKGSRDVRAAPGTKDTASPNPTSRANGGDRGRGRGKGARGGRGAIGRGRRGQAPASESTTSTRPVPVSTPREQGGTM